MLDYLYLTLVSLLYPFLTSSSPPDLKNHLYTDESKIFIFSPDISSSSSVYFVSPFMWMVTLFVTWAKKNFKFSLKTISVPVLYILVNQTTIYPIVHTISWSFFPPCISPHLFHLFLSLTDDPPPPSPLSSSPPATVSYFLLLLLIARRERLRLLNPSSRK